MNFEITSNIVDGIKKNNSDAIKYIYKANLHIIRGFVVANQGTPDDAKEIVQEALIIVISKVKKPDFTIKCNFNTYFYSICKHLWLNELRKINSKDIEYCDCDQFSNDVTEYNIELETKKRRIFRYHWNELSKDCKKVLNLYFKSTPVKEIQEIMGYSSEQYTWNKKFKCKKKLNEQIVLNPEYKTIRNELH